ncbi:MAG TPA: hypothetical protein VGP63_11950 [Planctomycetaceae bacterium]|jgi:hypothetical protein|nr:hypothetical protein [Planctomycetaceae bacterium]
MDVRIECPCGEHVIVTEASAGATLTCDCGRPISVPSLPALRVAAGLPPYDYSPEQVIEQLLAKGRLPGTNVCIHCGFETEQVLEVETECETQYRSNSGMPFWFVLVTALMAPITLLFRWGEGEVQWHGRDTRFLLPIPACEHCQRLLRRRKLLKEGMQRIAEYRRLLEKFPQARLKLRARPVRSAL